MKRRIVANALASRISDCHFATSNMKRPGRSSSFAGVGLVEENRMPLPSLPPSFQGSIEDIAYFGSHSVYHVRLPSGQKVLANFANSQRWASERFTWNDPVWLWWGDDAGVVLTA